MPEKLLHIDTETTGLYAPGAGLVQVAGIVEIDGEEVETFDLRYLPNFKLATVAQAMRITADGDPHDALTDVRLSAGIWRRLLRAAEKKGILR